MLFSDKNIAQYINDNFEPAWESERPVPTVTIDFGQGKEIKRTLHGNIATYICTPDGFIVDVLPGIYSPDKYLENLKQLNDEARMIASRPDADKPRLIYNYHLDRLTEINKQARQKLRAGQESAFLAVGTVQPARPPRPDFRKFIVEQPLKRTVFAPPETSKTDATVDSAFNEEKRRAAIHRMLASSGLIEPAAINRWLYKKVLHADLDDPYLGLKSYLGETYPWTKEESANN